jgi:hypothetical protein
VSGWNTSGNGADAARQVVKGVPYTFDNALTRQARGQVRAAQGLRWPLQTRFVGQRPRNPLNPKRHCRSVPSRLADAFRFPCLILRALFQLLRRTMLDLPWLGVDGLGLVVVRRG